MKDQLKTILKKIPIINSIGSNIYLQLKSKSFPGSKGYWENRYIRGGNSGDGSYGESAKFKAKIINAFVRDSHISSVVDFGCGDGNQLSLFDFPCYVGFDVSKTAIQLCKKHFDHDKTKSFFIYNAEHFDHESATYQADLALSLEVIFHLVEDKVFETYMRHLFLLSNKYVIIFAYDKETCQRYHEKHRHFVGWIADNLPEWKLIKKIDNQLPVKGADFFIYEKKLK